MLFLVVVGCRTFKIDPTQAFDNFKKFHTTYPVVAFRMSRSRAIDVLQVLNGLTLSCMIA